MPLHIKIVDDAGNPDPVSSLADVIIDRVREKGVGIFRGENHVAEDIRTAIHELIRSAEVVVQPPTLLMVCPQCQDSVGIWHTYPDGTVLCTNCKPKVGIEDE